MSAYLELFALQKVYDGPHGAVPVVEGFDLSLARGEFVSLVGHSGCGKSTVLAMVAGLAELSNGGIVLDGREIDGPGPDRGVVFQAPCLLPWMNALDNVRLGVDRVFPYGTRAERRAIAEWALVRVGLAEAGAKTPSELSLGEQQRVGIARALALSPKLLLLDEPFGMVDALTRLELQDLLIELCAREGTTALLVTHDVDEALFLSDRVALMTKGPRARVGEIVPVTMARPRDRGAFLEHPDYYALRERLISFLEEQDDRPEPVLAADLVPPAPATLRAPEATAEAAR